MKYTVEDTYHLFTSALKKFGISKLKDELLVNKNTIKRWQTLENVPTYYFFDLCNIMDVEIDYDSFSAKEKDQFFTSKKSVNYCLSILSQKLEELGIDESEYTYIEPSAGNGSFYNELPKDRRVGLDIEPKSEGILKHNFLKWSPSESKKYITIGNPPFGLRGNLALRFINHSSKFSEFVVFILPQLFESDGKGSCKGRVEGMNLIHSEKIDPLFHYPNGTNVKVNVVSQIWSKNFKVETEKFSCSNFIKIYSVSDGGTPGTTRNKDFLNSCDVYLPTTCFGVDNMKLYYDFENLPQRRGYGIKILKDFDTVLEVFEKINWVDKSFKSTNGAFNLRFDLIEKSLSDYGIKNPLN
jgi:hypothetical protein